MPISNIVQPRTPDNQKEKKIHLVEYFLLNYIHTHLKKIIDLCEIQLLIALCKKFV